MFMINALKECLGKAVKDLLSLADKVRSFGVKVYHVEKAYDDDLYFTVEASHEGWERALRYLWGLGFRTVAKYDFTDFESLKWHEENVDRYLIPVHGLNPLNR